MLADFKLSTSRDFRINTALVQANLAEQASGSEEVKRVEERVGGVRMGGVKERVRVWGRGQQESKKGVLTSLIQTNLAEQVSRSEGGEGEREKERVWEMDIEG